MGLLIIGCPRSGTVYIARVLQAIGIKVGHEYEDRDGMVSWGGAVDRMTVNGRSFGRNGTHYDKKDIWHQVRDPMLCIPSMNVFTGKLREDIWNLVPFSWVEGIPSLANWALFWIYWNRFCESQASRTYRIEDIDTVFPEMMTWRGRQDCVLPDIPRNMNTRDPKAPHIPLKYSLFKKFPDIYDLLIETSNHYGYLERVPWAE